MKRTPWSRMVTCAPKGRTIAAAVPLVLVNTVAFAGQLAFLRARLPWPLPGQVCVAAALESIAIFLALHAHVAALANDSALRLRLAAYGFAAVIGACNYSHYAAPGWRPTFAAVAVGLMSASSPFLWGVHSRRVSRDALMTRGLIEPHALRLGVTRWLWHPCRSARVMFAATWEGVTEPHEAITRWEGRRQQKATDAPPLPLLAEPLTLPPAAAVKPRDSQEKAAQPQRGEGTRTAARKAQRKVAVRPSDAERAAQIRALLEGGQKVTIDGAMELLGAGRPVAKRVLALANQNGHGERMSQ